MSFFESEDEKWMMGDFDIDLDVDLGRPIDFEADESVTNQDDSGFLDGNSSGNVDPRKGTSGLVASASAQRSGTVSVPGNNNNLGNSGLGSSTNGNNNSARRSGGSNLINSTSTGASSNGNNNNDNGNKEVSFQPGPNVRFGGNGNGNNRGQPPNGSNGNGNDGRPNSTAQPSGSGNGRPSAGGFSFPPGIVRVIVFSLFPVIPISVTTIAIRTNLG